MFTLEDGSAVKLTTALFLTPKGHFIQARGVTPDILVDATGAAEQSDRLREADLEGHLPAAPNAAEPAKTRPVAAAADSKAPPQVPNVKAGEGEVGSQPDPQLKRAVEFLKQLKLADNR